jgi:hypothetical protein
MLNAAVGDVVGGLAAGEDPQAESRAAAQTSAIPTLKARFDMIEDPDANMVRYNMTRRRQMGWLPSGTAPQTRSNGDANSHTLELCPFT